MKRKIMNFLRLLYIRSRGPVRSFATNVLAGVVGLWTVGGLLALFLYTMNFIVEALSIMPPDPLTQKLKSIAPWVFGPPVLGWSSWLAWKFIWRPLQVLWYDANPDRKQVIPEEPVPPAAVLEAYVSAEMKNLERLVEEMVQEDASRDGLSASKKEPISHDALPQSRYEMLKAGDDQAETGGWIGRER